MNDERQLIDGFLDGELTADEERRLAEWLAADREHVRQFVRETCLHRQLRETMLARQFQTDALGTVDRAARQPWPWPVRVLTQLFALPWTPALRRAWLPITACLALVAGFGVWWFGPTVGEPVLAEVQGTGLSLERAGQTLPAGAGTRLQSGDVLRAPENVTAAISFAPENTRIMIKPGTELKVTELSHGKRFALGLGKLEASVARQRPFRPLVVTTAQAEARVLGTRFTLAATTNATRLEVADGKVRLKRLSDGEAVRVGAGNYTVAAPGYELAPQPLTGSILREYWTNLPGEYFVTFLTSHPDFPDHPSGREYLKKFEGPSHWGKNYGARIRGYVHPPLTGAYTFWIASSDGGELFLSPDDDPESKVQIGYANGTVLHEWTKDRSQQSSAITLAAGRKYYIEALQKQGKGDDHLAVAWQRPGREREVIPGEYLSPPESKTKDKKR